MANPLLAPELRERIAAGDSKALRDFCEAGHPAVIAEMLSALSPPEAWEVWTTTSRWR
jgi:magnesium transporter